MARKGARQEPIEAEEEAASGDESGDGGLVGRLFKRSVGAPGAALKGLGEQFNGWKSEFMQIFQSEIRRFLDRVDAGDELRKVIEGKRLEISASIRLVDDDAPRGGARREGEARLSAEDPPRAKKKKKTD